MTRVIAALLFGLAAATPVRAQAPDAVELIVAQGTPLRVALDNRVKVKRVGQPVMATVVEPVYAYDRIVIPAGTPVLGHVAGIEGPSRRTRIGAMVGGDFAPSRRVVLAFDTIVLNGESTSIHTGVSDGIENMRKIVAAPPGAPARSGRAGEEVKRAEQAVRQDVQDAVSAIRQPRRMARLRDTMIRRLPYHPQFLAKGTVYSAALTSPLRFGIVSAVQRADPGTLPAPSSVLNARLVTAVDSAHDSRGAPIAAVLTAPIFSADHHLVLPAGATLRGSVTFAKRARHFHRNGQLRFLFESVEDTSGPSSPLLASLHSVQSSAGARVSLDEEGGASVSNSKARFVAPALAMLALSASAEPQGAEDVGAAEVGAGGLETGNTGSRGAGGFFGFGLAGTVASQFSKPVAIGLSAMGAARTVYSSVFGRGREVSFPADTPIQVQLAPGTTPEKK